MLEQHFAGRQQLHASGGSLEELDPELVLEGVDLSAERRLRDV